MRTHTTPPLCVVHLDLKGVPPTPARLCELPALFAALGFGAILVEWEDTFPIRRDARHQRDLAYSSAEVEAFYAAARAARVEIIPLQQTLSHLETFLAPDDYASLREVESRVQTLCPLAPNAVDFAWGLCEEVLSLGGDVRFLHMGGDEAEDLGRHPATHAYDEKHGRGAAFGHFYSQLFERCEARGIRPMLWHDMLAGCDDAVLESLLPRCEVVIWNYGPDLVGMLGAELQHLHGRGAKLWAGGGFKGAGDGRIHIPIYALHDGNAREWMALHADYEFKGLIATGWSRFATCLQQTVPLDGAWDSLANIAEIFAGGAGFSPEQAARKVEELGQGEVFGRCRAALVEFGEAVEWVWHQMQHRLEQRSIVFLEPTRADSSRTMHAGWFADAKTRAELAGEALVAAFAGLVPELAMRRYVGERFYLLFALGEELMGAADFWAQPGRHLTPPSL